MASRDEFPVAPVAAVGAVVFRGRAVLLVKRASPPHKGRWTVPGGALEYGETVEAAAVRETFEETGVRVRPLRVLDVKDFIEREGGEVRWHYVLVDVLCEALEGEPVPASDAENARFIPLREIDEYDVTPTALEVIRSASTFARERTERDGS